VQMSVCWVWVRKYLSILVIKTNFKYKEYRYHLIEYCSEYIQQISKEIREINNDSLDKNEKCLKKLIIGLSDLEEDCALLYEKIKE
jgi:hypothetical protein